MTIYEILCAYIITDLLFITLLSKNFLKMIREHISPWLYKYTLYGLILAQFVLFMWLLYLGESLAFFIVFIHWLKKLNEYYLILEKF